MPKLLIHRLKLAGFSACSAFLLMGSAQAQTLEPAVQAETKINEDAATSQQRVTNLAKQTQDLLTEYRSVVRETESPGNLQRQSGKGRHRPAQ